MFVARHILAFDLLVIVGLVFALLVILASRFHYQSVTLIFQKPVDVSTNLPASLTNAVLYLKVFEPSDSAATNYRSW
jgi:hypothetical protein